MILITRPQKQALKTKELFESHGYTCKIFPLMKIQYDWDALNIIGQYSSVIVTSIHAAKVIVKSGFFTAAKFYVVGEKVAHYLSKHHYEIVECAPTSATLKTPKHSIIHISGDYIAHDFGFDRIAVYSSFAVTAMPNDLLNDVDIVMFYSPRTARIFKKLTPPLKNISAICISFNTALPLKDLDFKQIYIAENPTEQSMLKLLNAK